MTNVINLFNHDEETRYKERVLTAGVTLIVFESRQAAIEFSDNQAIEFMYTQEVENILDNLSDSTALELIEALSLAR